MWANFDTHQTKVIFVCDKRTELKQETMTFVLVIPQGEAERGGATVALL